MILSLGLITEVINHGRRDSLDMSFAHEFMGLIRI